MSGVTLPNATNLRSFESLNSVPSRLESNIAMGSSVVAGAGTALTSSACCGGLSPEMLRELPVVLATVLAMLRSGAMTLPQGAGAGGLAPPPGMFGDTPGMQPPPGQQYGTQPGTQPTYYGPPPPSYTQYGPQPGSNYMPPMPEVQSMEPPPMCDCPPPETPQGGDITNVIPLPWMTPKPLTGNALKAARETSLKTLQDNFAPLSDGRVITMKSLAAAAGKEDATQSTKNAFQFFKNNPAEFNKLDMAASYGTSQFDHEVSKMDIKTELSADAPKLTDSQDLEHSALSSLKQNFNTIAGSDGTVTIDDIHNAAEGAQGKNADMMQMAQYFEAHPDKLKKLDAANNPKADSNIDMKDVDSRLKTLDDVLAKQHEAPLQTLKDNFSKISKNKDTMTMADLQDAVKNPELKGDGIKEACQFFIDNPSEFGKLDGAMNGNKDGAVALGDTIAAINGKSTPTENNQEQKDALKGLQDNWDKLATGGDTELISFDTLNEAAAGRGAGKDPKIQKVAEYFVTHPDAMSKADTADTSTGNAADRFIGRGDIESRLKDMPA